MVTIANLLNVLPNDLIIVPNTEPSSTTTSTTMESEMRKIGIQSPSVIALKDALALLPGSHVIIMQNFNAPLQKFFVLPAADQTCPCTFQGDWYRILQQHSRPATQEETDSFVPCDAFENTYDHLLS